MLILRGFIQKNIVSVIKKPPGLYVYVFNFLSYYLLVVILYQFR